jgi:hypothetical protein
MAFQSSLKRFIGVDDSRYMISTFPLWHCPSYVLLKRGLHNFTLSACCIMFGLYAYTSESSTRVWVALREMYIDDLSKATSLDKIGDVWRLLVCNNHPLYIEGVFVAIESCVAMGLELEQLVGGVLVMER